MKEKNKDTISVVFLGAVALVASLIGYYLGRENEVLGRQLDDANKTIDRLSVLPSTPAEDVDVDSLSMLLHIERAKVSLAEKNYGISFRVDSHQRNGQLERSISTYAPRIDSALLLLDVYRDMITYDKEERVWSVSRISPSRVVSSSIKKAEKKAGK
nr:MAG TPA: hypothetical protein [Caudoviricetes sp.]